MLAWILVVGIVVANVIPASDRPNMGVGHTTSICSRSLLSAFVFTLAYSWRLKVLISSGIVFALLLELAQIPLPTRHTRIEDFLVDALGTSLGVTLAYLARSACKSSVV